MMNFDVKARINIPTKVPKPNLVGLFPRRLWLLPTTTWASRKRKVSFKVEEKEVNKVVVVEGIESVAKSAFRFGFSAALSFCIFCHAPTALSQSLTVAFPVSRAPESAADDMRNAIQEMKNQGAHSYILDLRNNPGGLVKAGLDVAQMWLDGDETLVNTIDRDGNMSPINMVNGHAITHDPLVVIVNEGSASASEILAGALHDNGRAILVGNKTFGKGKIQSVTQLHDGSALFVTVAKYVSPALHDIDQVGIMPDVQCTTEMLNSPKELSTKDKTSISSLEADSCIMVAEHELDMKDSKGTVS